MKVLKALIILIVVLAVIFCVTAVYFLKTTDFNAFKDDIAERASAALGREVKIENLSFLFSFKKGTVLDLSGLTIAEDPRWREGNFLEVDQLYVSVDVLAFLLERKIKASDVRLVSPKIVLIQNQYNRWNTHDFIKKKDEEAEGKPKPKKAKDASDSPTKAKKGFDEVFVHSIHVEKGVLTYINKNTDFLSPLTVSDIDMAVDGFSLEEEPFNFSVKSSVWSSRQNVSVAGKVRISPQSQQARFDDVRIKVALSKLYEDHTSSPLLDEFKALKQWRGKMDINVSQMVVGKEGVLVLSADGKLSDSEARLVGLPVTFKNIIMIFNATEDDVEISSYSTEVAGGKVLGSAQLDNYRKNYRLKSKTEVVRLKLPELIDLGDSDMRLQGELFGLIELNAAKDESAETNDFLRDLKGKISFEIQGGRLVGLNILKLAFKKMTFMPDLLDIAVQTIPNKYKRVLIDNDTEFKAANLEAEVKGARADISRAVVVSDKYQVEIDGYCDFNLYAFLKGGVFLSEDFARNMVQSEPAFKSLAEPDGRIKIPFKPYEGPIEYARLQPDVSHLGRLMVIERGSRQLDRLLDDVFGGGGESTPQGEEGEEPVQQKSPERVLIEGVLDSIFNKE